MKVIMIDQDGVVNNRDYQTTKDISKLFKELSSREDILIVPNSDTPIERLIVNFQELLSFSATWVVGEKGAVVWNNGKYFYSANIAGISDYLSKLKDAFSKEFDCDIVEGDSATDIRKKRLFQPNRNMLIIDALRKQSVGFYLRRTNESGLPEINDCWFNLGSELVKQFIIPEGLEANDFNAKYGIVIMNSKGINKTSGYRILRRFYPHEEFYMIGDGKIDIIDDCQVCHCSVANAIDELKEKSSFVSAKGFTEGLEDCLSWIINK